MRAEPDVRRTNWWYVIPPSNGPVLVVGESEHAEAFPRPVVAGTVDEALRALLDGPFAGIAIPDVDAVIPHASHGTDLLRALAASVEPGGWFYAGFANRPLRGDAWSVAKVHAALRLAGLDGRRVFLAAPDHVTPAYLIPAGRRAEVDFFLNMLFFPYTTTSGTRAAARRLALRFLRVGASVSPPWLRARAWPSVAIVARRSPR